MARQRFDISELTPWIEIRFGPAAGPGGQNVNKVSTRATLLFDFAACPLLTAPQKTRLRQRLATRLSREGRLRIVSQRERFQVRNRAAAEQRLLELLTEALHVPARRRPTRPTAASRARRLTAKRQRGQIKRLRQRRPTADD
jgi:ribosome-associated protein